jgi:hypothetical protein
MYLIACGGKLENDAAKFEVRNHAFNAYESLHL